MKKILIVAFFALLASSTYAQTFTFECYCGDLSGVRCDICTGQTQTRFFCGLLIKKSGTVVKWIDAPYIIQWQGNNAIIKEIIPNPETFTINISGTSFANLAAFKAALECPCNVPGKLFYISDSTKFAKVMRGDTVTIVGNGGATVTLDTTNQKFIVTAAAGAAQVLSASGAGPTQYNIALSGGGGAIVLKEGASINLTRTADTITIANTAPDQTVVITGAGINVVTGTYPNFTITGTEVDGNTANEGLLGVGAGGAASSVLLSNTTGASGVTINAAGINAISETTSANGGQITITATEVDGSTTNELQTIANTSTSTTHTATLSNSGGSMQLVEGANVTLTTTGTGLDGIVTIAATSAGVSALNSLTGSVTIAGERGITVNTSSPNITIGLPTSTSTHTLRYDGTNWITNSQITNNGNEIGIGGAPVSGFEAYINGATRIDGAMVSRGTGNPVSGTTSPHARLWNTTATTGDTWYLASLDTGAFHIISSNLGASVLRATTAGQIQTNAGLRIGSVSGTPTSIIGRNASGDVGAISIGSGLTLSGGSLSASSSGGSNWTLSGSDIYRNSNVSVGTTTVGGAKLQVTDATDADVILATDGTLVSGDAFFRTSGTLGTTGGFAFAFDGSVSAAGSNVISRTFNTSTTNSASNAVHQVVTGGGSAGDPYTQYSINGVQTWSAGVDNSATDNYKISASAALGTSDVAEITTAGFIGFSTAPNTGLAANWGKLFPLGLPAGPVSNQNTGSVASIWCNTDFNRIEAKTVSGAVYKTLLSYNTPTAVKQAAMGSTGTATLSTGSNDKAGQLTLVVSGTGITSGQLVIVNFSASMVGSVFVDFSARNAAAAGQATNIFVGSQGSTSFSLNCNTALAAGTYIYNYIVQQ